VLLSICMNPINFMEEERSFTCITDPSVVPSKVQSIRAIIGIEEPDAHICNVPHP
jgi:hypothetical protein